VEEVIEDGVNGLLVDFFSPAQIAARIDEALSRQAAYRRLRAAARRTVVERYDLRRRCLPAQARLIASLSSPRRECQQRAELVPQ
jgi:glycosyltransferase involved in cell wall biosynthesis